MMPTIPVPAFRGNQLAYATRAPVLSGSLSDPAGLSGWSTGRTLHFAGVDHSYCQVTITGRGVTSDLAANEWRRNDGTPALAHRPFGDDEWRWQIQYRATGGDEWADANPLLVASPMSLSSAAGTATSVDLSSGQVGPQCHLVMGTDGSASGYNHGAGQYRAVATVRTRGPGGAFYTTTLTSETWTAVASTATRYYIAADGDDGNDGLSAGAPWASFDNVPATGSYVILLKDGDTIDTTTFEGMRASTDRHHAVYGVAGASPVGATVRAVTGFNDARHLWESNYNGTGDETTDSTFCHISVDCNGIARGGWQTVDTTAEAACVFDGVSWFGCTVSGINGGNAVSKGWDLSFGNADEREHRGLCWLDCHVVGVDNSVTSSEQLKQGWYTQGGRMLAWTGCTIRGAAIDATLDHMVYANNASDVLMQLCAADPGGTGLRQRGLMLNVGITLGHATAKRAGVVFVNNDCSGCKLGLDTSQSQFDAGAGWSTHTVDDVVCEGNYMTNAGVVGDDTSCNGIASLATTENHWVRNNVGNNIGRDLFAYAANTTKLSDRSQQYDDLPRGRIGNNDVVNADSGDTGRLFEIATFARGVFDIDLGRVAQPDTGSTRHFARYDRAYMESAAHAAAGGGIAAGDVTRATGSTARVLSRTITDAPTYAESEAYTDESTLETAYPGVSFGDGAEGGAGYADPDEADFSGVSERPAAPALPSGISALAVRQNTELAVYDGDVGPVRVLVNGLNWRIDFGADSYGVTLNSPSARDCVGIPLLSPRWDGLGGFMHWIDNGGADGAYQYNNNGKGTQQGFMYVQHHLDHTGASGSKDIPGWWVGNTDNLWKHFSDDGGATHLVVADYHAGGFVTVHDGAVVTAVGPAQNEYYRWVVDAALVDRWSWHRNKLTTGTQKLAVRPVFLMPDPVSSADNVLRTLCDLSSVGITDTIGAIAAAGIDFRGAAANIWRQQVGGALNTASGSIPEAGRLATLMGTGDKASQLGDLIVEPSGGAYAFGIRHNTLGISSGKWLPAAGPVIAYPVDDDGARIPGPYVTFRAENSVSFADIGAGTSTGASGFGLKNTAPSEEADWYWQTRLDEEGILLVFKLAEELASLATIQAAVEARITAARAAYAGLPVYVLLWTNFMHLESGTSEADMRTKIESNRGHYRTLVSTLKGTAYNRADQVGHFSQYDAMRGHLLNGSAQSIDYLIARGGTAFERPGGQGTVNFNGAAYASDLLDTEDLHIDASVGSTVEDRNRAGEFMATDAALMLIDTLTSLTRGGLRSRAGLVGRGRGR